nr:TMV resistance protein N-like [Ipomoea batatas]
MPASGAATAGVGAIFPRGRGLFEDREINRDGQPKIRHAVLISEEKWDRLAAIERRNTLIGRFGRKRPDLEQVRAELRANLSDVQIGSLNARTIMMHFSDEEAYNRVLMRDRLMVGGVSIWISRWSPSWSPWRDSPLVPVWIEFPRLPLHLFDFSMLSRICESFGSLLALDMATIRRSRPSVAKARVEIDLSRPLPNRLTVGERRGVDDGGEPASIKIENEDTPPVCGNASMGIEEPNAPVVEETEQIHDVGELQQNSFSGCEIIEGGLSGRCKGRRRRKKRGFRVGNALQILALDYGDEEWQDGLEKWIEDLKNKVGHDEGLVQAVDEAYEEVLELFEEALEELGQPGEDVDDELICKTALIFWKKWENFVQDGKELSEIETKQPEALLKFRSISPSTYSGGARQRATWRHTSFRWAEAELVSGTVTSVVSPRSAIKDGMSSSDSTQQQQLRRYDWLEESFRGVRRVDLMNEVLKEINSYMQVVYDEIKQVFWEEESSMALKGCRILMEIVKASPVRGLLHPKSELGYHLLMNEDVIGRRLCRWAWRRFRRGWEEKLRRLDVNFYCN